MLRHGDFAVLGQFCAESITYCLLTPGSGCIKELKIKGATSREFSCFSQFCAKSLLGGFTHIQTAPVKL